MRLSTGKAVTHEYSCGHSRRYPSTRKRNRRVLHDNECSACTKRIEREAVRAEQLRAYRIEKLLDTAHALFANMGRVMRQASQPL